MLHDKSCGLVEIQSRRGYNVSSWYWNIGWLIKPTMYSVIWNHYTIYLFRCDQRALFHKDNEYLTWNEPKNENIKGWDFVRGWRVQPPSTMHGDIPLLKLPRLHSCLMKNFYSSYLDISLLDIMENARWGMPATPVL